MTIRADTPASVTLTEGATWAIGVTVLDADGLWSAAVTPVVTITVPDGTTDVPDVTALDAGHSAEYVVTQRGRHLAVATAAGYGLATFTAWVDVLTLASDLPVVADWVAYTGGTTSWEAAEIQGALEAEAAAQRRRLRIPAAYTADLREALLRRVSRNLAMRALPLAVLRGDQEAGKDTVLPGRDPEVRRLEAPYVRLPVG